MSGTESKKKIVEALDEVSKKLGNTRTVCKKYYVHPGLLKLYEENSLKQYLDKLDEIENPEIAGEHTGSEQILMKILKTLQSN
jgi:DNA topoisomerase-1